MHFNQNRRMSSLSSDFKNAAERLKSLNTDPGNDIKLKLYALFKQVFVIPLLGEMSVVLSNLFNLVYIFL